MVLCHVTWRKPMVLQLLQILLLITVMQLDLLGTEARQPQRIVISPTDSKVVKGQTAVLPCKVANQKGPVQWTKNGFALGVDRELPFYERYRMIGSSAEGEYNLEISYAELSDDDVYRCQVGQTAEQAGQMSAPARLFVLVPPTAPRLVNHGTLITGNEGQTFTVSCAADNGKPEPELKWFVSATADGRNVLRALHVEGLPEVRQHDKVFSVLSNLRYTPIKADDGNYLVCSMTHDAVFGNQVASAVLAVQYPPKVTVTLNSTEPLREGSSALLSCNADAKPKSRLQYKWYQNGNVMHTQSQVYNIPNLRKDVHHGSVYSCEVSNDVGSDKGSYTILIMYGPRSVEGPKKILAEEGSTVSLQCNFDSNPMPTFKWTKVGAGDEILHEGPNLTIPNVKHWRQGVYRCEAYLPGFPIAFQNYTLLIKGPPKVLLPTKLEAAEGSTVEIPCHISGIPSPQSIEWYKGPNGGVPFDAALADDEKKRFSIHIRPNPDGSQMSVLQIVNVYGNDFDYYNCSATNSYGIDYSQTRLISVDPIPLYVMIPGVIGGVVAILVLALALVIVNRKYLCHSKSSQSDEHSDVMVKMEALDGGIPPNGYYPDMYTSLTEQMDAHYISGKEYMALPTAEGYDDNLPPPYPPYCTTFGSHSPTNGHVVHVTYLDNSQFRLVPSPGHLQSITADGEYPPLQATPLTANGNGRYIPYTNNGTTVNGGFYVPRTLPINNNNNTGNNNTGEVWEPPNLSPNSGIVIVQQPQQQNGHNHNSTGATHFYEHDLSNGIPQQQYAGYHLPVRIYNTENYLDPALEYQPSSGHPGMVPTHMKPLEPVQEVPTPEVEFVSGMNEESRTLDLPRASSSQSTHSTHV